MVNILLGSSLKPNELPDEQTLIATATKLFNCLYKMKRILDFQIRK